MSNRPWAIVRDTSSIGRPKICGGLDGLFVALPFLVFWGLVYSLLLALVDFGEAGLGVS